MMRLAGLSCALVGLIFVRATSANFVPVWSFMWWMWILATCAIAWLAGWAHHSVWDRRQESRRRRY